ncbi:dr1-associated corepressor isoform X2 [Paralichthys olivaceus]|uniref:dr1-associated corepressor isoform X2 n=1 Tax=Paralichthys olivaceus TaxID=8255 RepID=UPI00097D92FE|nr:PREDICTED: dr1-associated corepressor isoform X2 [Paralichthys olivaceus]
MPSKKKKYNARFPPARIKKIMQTDEEIGKVAAAVPVIISRALELFLESLLTKACQVTQSRNAKTMTTSHLGRKPGTGRKNGGVGSKGKDKKLSGTESEQEDDSEDSETEGDEEDGSQSSTNLQAAARFHSSNAPPQYTHMGNMVSAGSMAPAQPQGTMAFAPHPSMMSAALPPPAPAPHKNEDDDDEDYDS